MIWRLLQQYMHFTWSSLIQIIVCLILLVRIVGFYAALVGFAVMLLLAPIQHRFMNVIRDLKSGISKWTDSRIKLMNELLQGIRIIKINAWESFFSARLASLRLSEMTQIRTAALYNVAYSTVRYLFDAFEGVARLRSRCLFWYCFTLLRACVLLFATPVVDGVAYHHLRRSVRGHGLRIAAIGHGC
jgi:hypothetical protein